MQRPERTDAGPALYCSAETASYFRALDGARDAPLGEKATAMAVAVQAYAGTLWTMVRPAVEARATPRIACTAGCRWCCHQQVALLPVEAIAITRHLERLASSERSAVATRVATLDGKTRGLSAIKRARLKEPCAFMVDGACSIYPVRPLRCRSLHSRNSAACFQAMADPDAAAASRATRADPGPFVVESAKIMDAALKGLARACRDLGLAHETVELTAAVQIALDSPDAEAKILAGDPLFGPAALPLAP
jgi:hypothetical protein